MLRLYGKQWRRIQYLCNITCFYIGLIMKHSVKLLCILQRRSKKCHCILVPEFVHRIWLIFCENYCSFRNYTILNIVSQRKQASIAHIFLKLSWFVPATYRALCNGLVDDVYVICKILLWFLIVIQCFKMFYELCQTQIQ